MKIEDTDMWEISRLPYKIPTPNILLDEPTIDPDRGLVYLPGRNDVYIRLRDKNGKHHVLQRVDMTPLGSLYSKDDTPRYGRRPPA
jgi:sugar lactone lactonase YvrE